MDGPRFCTVEVQCGVFGLAMTDRVERYLKLCFAGGEVVVVVEIT